VGLLFVSNEYIRPLWGLFPKKGPDQQTGADPFPGPAREPAPRIGHPWHDPVAELALTTLEKPHPLAGPATLAAFACHYGFRISLMH